MKVNQLFEEDEKRKFDSDLNELINKFCHRNFASVISGYAPTLFRGSNNSKDRTSNAFRYCLMPPRANPRVSLTDFNLFNSYVSAAPAWKSIPKRNKSYFCTADFYTAQEFGDAKLIIPFDNVRSFAACESDFNDIVVNGKNLHAIGQELQVALVIIEDDVNYFDDKLRQVILSEPALKIRLDSSATIDDISKLSAALTRVQRYLLKSEPITRGKRLAEILNFFNPNLLEWFHRNIVPSKLEINQFNSFDQVKIYDPTSEVWFDGGYLGIALSDYLEMGDVVETEEILEILKDARDK